MASTNQSGGEELVLGVVKQKDELRFTLPIQMLSGGLSLVQRSMCSSVRSEKGGTTLNTYEKQAVDKNQLLGFSFLLKT